MSKRRTTSPAKRGRERLTFRRWALLLKDGSLLNSVSECHDDVRIWAKLLGGGHVVRVTVTVDPPRRRAGKAGKR